MDSSSLFLVLVLLKGCVSCGDPVLGHEAVALELALCGQLALEHLSHLSALLLLDIVQVRVSEQGESTEGHKQVPI